MVTLGTGGVGAAQPQAIVYRGPATCDGCPEAVAKLLESSKFKFKVNYAGPNEVSDINADTLKGLAVYAQPGGPDLDDAWDELRLYAKDIQDFVSNGGRYLGFCLGAYLAGSTPGFDLLPSGVDADSEIDQDGAQVRNDKDTVIEVDWHFSTGLNAGKTQQKRWLYFQEGSVITGIDSSSANVLAKYSSNGDVAATLTSYGKGWVGLVGPHPEATQEWYSNYNIENPEGVKFDIGYDFVEAAMNGGKANADTHGVGSRSETPIHRQAKGPLPRK